MSYSIYGRFSCRHCGCKFNLNDDEMEAFEGGFFENNPDCCDDCYYDQKFEDYPEFSDADPGL